ncbi:N-acetylmuramoyl-L-alanine amidase family protein, partial [Vibrio parahaemolyticus SBR10290]
SY